MIDLLIVEDEQDTLDVLCDIVDDQYQNLRFLKAEKNVPLPKKTYPFQSYGLQVIIHPASK